MTDIIQTFIQTNSLNFIIVLAVLIFILSKLKINEKINKLRDDIKSYVDNSTSEKALAQKELEETEEKIKHLPEETQLIETSAENNIKGLEQKIKREIEDKKNDIKTSADRILNLEIKQFKAKLTSILSEKSVILAKDNAIEQLKNNRELHNKYIDEAIEEIGRLSL